MKENKVKYFLTNLRNWINVSTSNQITLSIDQAKIVKLNSLIKSPYN